MPDIHVSMLALHVPNILPKTVPWIDYGPGGKGFYINHHSMWVRHAGRLSHTPPRWQCPSVPLGSASSSASATSGSSPSCANAQLPASESRAAAVQARVECGIFMARDVTQRSIEQDTDERQVLNCHEALRGGIDATAGYRAHRSIARRRGSSACSTVCHGCVP